MALQKVFELTGDSNVMIEGVSVSTGPQTLTLNCYVKIETICGDKTKSVMRVSFTDGVNTFIRTYSLAPSLGNVNAFKEGYAHLKTRPEFTGSTDV
jgi:hypothetical protein